MRSKIKENVKHCIPAYSKPQQTRMLNGALSNPTSLLKDPGTPRGVHPGLVFFETCLTSKTRPAIWCGDIAKTYGMQPLGGTASKMPCSWHSNSLLLPAIHTKPFYQVRSIWFGMAGSTVHLREKCWGRLGVFDDSFATSLSRCHTALCTAWLTRASKSAGCRFFCSVGGRPGNAWDCVEGRSNSISIGIIF